MDWTGSQDRRPANNAKIGAAHGYFIEEGEVHADDGTTLGTLVASSTLGRPQPEGMVFARLDLMREDRVQAMQAGAQS